MSPLPPYVERLLTRDIFSAKTSSNHIQGLVKRSANVYKRDLSSSFVPGQGSKPPGDFNNQAYLALFASIGAAMVLASIWFFFWAKNGGFHYQENDWDDYKSTVLRRKGPDGKTLSNATKSTKLGGSTIAGTQHYKWAKQSAKSVVSRDEKGRKGITGKRGFGKSHSMWGDSDNSYMTETFGTQTVSDMTEVREREHQPEPKHHSKRYRDRDMHDYKREKAARVGGLNRVADGSNIASTYNGSNPASVYNGSNITSVYNGSDVYSQASSDHPILPKPPQHNHRTDKNHEKERAERRAREEAAKMERRWKKEAEEAAASLARENARAIPQPKKVATPSVSKPSPTKQRASSRSTSPKKRDFSYQTGAASEVMSTAYTASTSDRTASYYEAYRPRAESNTYSPSEHANRSRQSSPKKKTHQPRASQGGYRRGADSDLD